MNDEDEWDYDEDEWDHCYECSGYGNDYSFDDDGELICYCPNCLMNPDWEVWNESND
jgi:hypothetical protein